MPEYRCACGRRIEYDVVEGKFRERKDVNETILKIRCSEQTKEIFKRLKERTESPSYESLLQLLISVASL
jgi:hypothetical protein